ncbi:hypothetical protein [Roseibium sp.]|uniref:hypothetical protein n=1 Tax=Roseibium sp. TaxID=1936156 RepID=UPI003BAC2783
MIDHMIAPPPLADAEQLQLCNFLLALAADSGLSFTYTNYRGETSQRRVKPLHLWHGSTEHHPKPTLLLCGLDLDKNAERDFKLTDIDMSTMRRTDAKEQNER